MIAPKSNRPLAIVISTDDAADRNVRSPVTVTPPVASEAFNAEAATYEPPPTLIVWDPIVSSTGAPVVLISTAPLTPPAEATSTSAVICAATPVDSSSIAPSAFETSTRGLPPAASESDPSETASASPS